jgi:hypothetical protein
MDLGKVSKQLARKSPASSLRGTSLKKRPSASEKVEGSDDATEETAKKRPAALLGGSRLNKQPSASLENMVPGNDEDADKHRMTSLLPASPSDLDSGLTEEDAAAKLKKCICAVLKRQSGSAQRDKMVDNVMAAFASNAESSRKAIILLVKSIDLSAEEAVEQMALVCSRLPTLVLCGSRWEHTRKCKKGTFVLLDDVWEELNADFDGMSPSEENLRIVVKTKRKFFEMFLANVDKTAASKQVGIEEVRSELVNLSQYNGGYLDNFSIGSSCSDLDSNVERKMDDIQ